MRIPALYRCAICETAVPAHQPSNLVVGDVRLKRYPPRERNNHQRKKKKGWADPGGAGWEAVRVDRVCRTCLPEAEARFQARLSALRAPAPSVFETDLS